MKGTMNRSYRLPVSKEEKVAVSIGKLLADFTLDLEAVGKYLATAQSYVIYRRAVEVLEATQYNHDVAEYKEITKHYSQGSLFN